MTQLFGIPLDTLTTILLVVTVVIIGGVVLLALGNALFFKIGVRNIPRRRTQMILIIFALMLSTTLLSSVMATGDVVTGAVQSVATYNIGNVDETIEGGRGDIGFFDDRIYYELLRHTRNDPDIAAVGAAILERNLLIADETSRQVRSNVNALAALPGSEQGFGGMQNANGKGNLSISALGPNEVYLNQTTALLLNAHRGDTLYLYSQRWPGRRYQVHVRAIVANGGMIGEVPFLVTQVQTFRAIERRHDDLTQIFVANRTGGADLADRVEDQLEQWIPREVHVIKVKQLGVQNSQKAEDIFSRIFGLFALFVLAIGLLLIFLIFVLLAAERRMEMGMARAVGVQRRHLILTFLFEGVVYDLLSSFVGLLIGVGIGALLVTILGPILQRFDFPLKLSFQLRSLIISYCLGVIFTFFSVAISSWLVSRMTVVEAIRNLPERGRQPLSLAEIRVLLRQHLVSERGQPGAARSYKHVPDVLIELVRALVVTGLLPLLVGAALLGLGLAQTQVAPFSLGLSLLAIGSCLLVKAGIERAWRARMPGAEMRNRRLRRVMAYAIPAVAGLAICAYWALPFDVFASLGLPRFKAGIEIFFLAALMMVLGTAWALIANAELLLNPLLALSRWRPGWHVLSRLASSYPLHHRFRMGLSVVMFSLVVFAMTVMAVITNAMQNTYTNIDLQTGGYDIQGVAYFKALPLGLTATGGNQGVLGGSPDRDVRAMLLSHGINPNDFSAIGVRTTTVVGVIQPGASAPAWHIYPAQVISGGFLQGYGLRLMARAKGFNSDAAVWQALQAHPDYALIDSSALPYRPLGGENAPVYDPSAPSATDAGVPTYPPQFDPYYTFSMGGVYQGDTSFEPTPVWVAKAQDQNPSAIKLKIIGVVDNSDSSHFGLYISHGVYGAISPDPAAPQEQAYYFKVAPGQDKRALSLALGSAFLDNGLETTVLEDAVWQVRGPRILLSDILLGLVGLALLLGVAALAITGTRAVIERRQQIGMLRALGCGRRLLQGAFLCESLLVGVIGSVLGVALGLILVRNIFAVNFFERYQTGLVFAIPWGELGLIVGVALLASLLAALLPAWQAGRVTPIEALHYS